MKEVKTNGDKDALIVVVGNKVDKSGREVSTEEARAYADSIRAHYVEASAQTGENVQEIFMYLAQQNLKSKQSAEVFIDENPQASATQKKCC